MRVMSTRPGIITTAPPTPNSPEMTPANRPSSDTNTHVMALVLSPSPHRLGFRSENVPCCQSQRCLGWKRFAIQQIPTSPSRRSSSCSSRPVAPPLGQQRGLHGGERLELAYHAIAPVPRPPSPTSTAQRLPPDSNSMLQFH